jgi:hypothetical protein
VDDEVETELGGELEVAAEELALALLVVAVGPVTRSGMEENKWGFMFESSPGLFAFFARVLKSGESLQKNITDINYFFLRHGMYKRKPLTGLDSYGHIFLNYYR